MFEHRKTPKRSLKQIRDNNIYPNPYRKGVWCNFILLVLQYSPTALARCTRRLHGGDRGSSQVVPFATAGSSSASPASHEWTMSDDSDYLICQHTLHCTFAFRKCLDN